MAATTQVARTGRYRPRLRLGRTPILIVQCCIVVACVAMTTIAAMWVQEQQLRAATEERVLAVARSLAELDQVQDVIGDDDAGQVLQPLADIIAQSTGVDYVVITDDAGIRLTHPTRALRGQPVSTDPTAVLAGEEFLGIETGTIGSTLRSKVPIWRDGTVVGTASVGILESELAADRRASLFALLPWVLGATVVGTFAAALLTRGLNSRVLRLEAEVSELDVQRRLAKALRDQTHEFRTRLHSVYGLVEGGHRDAALRYIGELVPVGDRHTTTAEIDDPRLSALFAAAAAELRTHGGQLCIDPLSTVSARSINEADVMVIANVVWNAVEAVGNNGRVAVSIHADEGGVEVVVDDNGPGIDPQLASRLFDRGYSTKPMGPTGESRGIGLHLVMRTVTGRGGHVDHAVGRPIGSNPRQSDQPMTHIRTLVVDDDPVAAQLHAAYVEALDGFSLVASVHSGEAAIEVLSQVRIDLVLLDIHLPGFSGIEVLHRLRDPVMPPIDVIVISSSRDRVTVRQAMSAQLAGYLIKPFSKAMFHSRLEAYRDHLNTAVATNEDSFGQNDIDQFLARSPAGQGSPPAERDGTTQHRSLPQGLSMLTLKRVCDALAAGGAMTVREVASTTGVSRATARRYLEFLHENGTVDIAHRYGRPGRPELVYRVAVAVGDGW